MGNKLSLVGQRFGKLVVVERSEKCSPDRQIIWKCQCDCGNETYVRTGNLKNGHVGSCGCYKADSDLRNLEKTSRFAGTFIARMETKTPQKNNSTGVRGVYYSKGYYKAYITFKGEHKHLGYFKTLEKAAEARKKAEDDIQDELKRLRCKFESK